MQYVHLQHAVFCQLSVDLLQREMLAEEQTLWTFEEQKRSMLDAQKRRQQEIADVQYDEHQK